MDAETKDDTEEVPVVKKIPRAKEVPPKLSQKTIELLAEAGESAFDAGLPKTQPTDPPPNPPNNPPKPLPDLIAKPEDGVDCPNGETSGGPNGETNSETNGEADGEADEEMLPLVDETEV